MNIGVDLDGVLGDQVPHILGLLNQKYGLKLKKSDIRMWNQPIPNTNTDIEREIERALLDTNYVLAMPVIRGAVKFLRLLSSDGHFIMVVTSRPPEADEATLKWLRKKRLIFHEFRNMQGLGKERLPVDILIDDRLENIRAFAIRNNLAILFSQPWNQDRKSLSGLIEQGRVICANGWSDVIRILRLS